MRLRISILTLLFGLFSVGAFAQSTQSDYEIQKSFKTQYADYQQQLEEVSAPDSAQALITSIKEFDQKYSEHAELLDKALHPETYDQRIEKLKESSVIAMNRLKKIENQTQKLDKLQTQLTTYEQDLSKLNDRTDSLKQAMAKSIESEKQLSGMVRQYRENLEKRDELILAFIDSMVVAYQQMDLEALQDLENMDQKSRIQSNDALQMISSISQENLDILQQNANKLGLEDYMRMAEVQHQFEQMWSRLGTKIEEVYDGKNAETLANQVDKNISDWSQLLKTQTLATLKDSLAQNGIQVSGFETSDELYSSLNSYLDTKIKKTQEGSSKAGYKDFKQFQRFWNNVELQWSSNFVDAGIMDKSQMATLNQKVDTWAEIAQPRSNNILVYLLGASVLLAVALGVMLIREKKGKHQT